MVQIGYHILKGITSLLSKLPLGFHYACGSALSWLGGSVIRYRRDVVMTNLARSFPKMKYEELEENRKKFYRHFGDILAEAIWFGGCTDPRRFKEQKMVTCTNADEINSLFERSDSVMVLTAHSGNWELYGGIMSFASEQGFVFPENDVCVVYKRLTSKVWDRLMRTNRRAPIVDKEHYDGMVESMNVMRYMISNKDRKKLYVFITDQFPYGNSARIDVGEFMNQQTYSMDGGAKLAAKFGMAVTYGSFRCTERGKYTFTFKHICDSASEYGTEAIMKDYYKYLQEDLNAVPWNYLWTHKRWK